MESPKFRRISKNTKFKFKFDCNKAADHHPVQKIIIRNFGVDRRKNQSISKHQHPTPAIVSP